MSLLPVVLAIAQVAAGDPKQEARNLLNRGNEKFAGGDHAGALADFLAAYEAYPSPKILLNVAEAHRAMDDAVRAVDAYERFLEEASDPGEIEDEVKARIAELASRIGRLTITGDPDAVVLIDGAPPRGNAAVVAPGLHRVVATRDGHVDFVREVDVSAGKAETVEVTLAPMADATPPIDAPPVVVPIETTVEPPITETWWFWTAIVGGAVVVSAVIAGVAVSTGGDDFVPMGELGRSRTSEWESF
jgi:hypothetical protein